MFIRMSSGFTLIAIILLMIHYLMTNFIEYYKNVYVNKIDKAKTNEEKKELLQDYNLIKKQYQDIREYMLYILIIIVLLGFALYSKEKWDEYRDDFSLKKFIFGTGHCKGLNNQN